MTKEEAYKSGMEYLQGKIITWNELSDTNSFWNYVWDDMTKEDVIEQAEEAYRDRFGSDAEEMGFNPDELFDLL